MEESLNMKDKIKRALLVASLGMGLSACSPSHIAPYSIQAWRVWSGFTGDVCQLPTTEEPSTAQKIICVNGVKVSNVSLNAGEAYQIWVSCEQYKSAYACKEMSE